LLLTPDLNGEEQKLGRNCSREQGQGSMPRGDGQHILFSAMQKIVAKRSTLIAPQIALN